jgi:hypothetical protein
MKELTERVRELSTILQITIAVRMGKRWPIATQASAAIIPSMGTIVKPLRQKTWEEVKTTKNDV